ncbi:hypothetical protein J3F83DRAFT_760521 [Trichoderma novae-zelandiae]
MRRRPRPPVSGLSFQPPPPPAAAAAAATLSQATAILGTSAISSRRSRTRARSHSSRPLPQQRRQLSPSSSRFYSALTSLIESTAKESISSTSSSSIAPQKAMPAQTLSVPWDRLKRWIAEQEGAEQLGHNPKPMTKTQLAALSHIVNFVEGPEPDVSDQDYVSLLMQYVQAKRIQPLPTFTDQGLEVPIDGNFLMRWRTTCHVHVAGQTLGFPCEGHGITKGQPPPLFGAKKASKQYAAKHALAYLQSQASSIVPLPSLSKSTSGGAPLRPTVPPVAKDQNMSGSSVSIDPPALAVPPGDAVGAPLVPPSSSADMIAGSEPVADAQSESVIPDNAEFYSEKLPSILEQVARDGNLLNFGCPKYEIWEDPEKRGCFAGRAVFQNGGRIPSDVAQVAGAISKNLAKEQIAEEVLKYFRTEMDRRQGLIGRFAKAS